MDVTNRNIYRSRKTDDSAPKDEGWKEPKKFIKKLLSVKNNDNRCVNRYEILSNKDEENENDNVDVDMSDDSSEENIKDISFEDDEEMENVNSCGNLECEKSEYVKGPTREILLNEIKTLEQVIDIKSETIQMLKVKIEE